MTTATFSEKQRQAIEAMEGARSEGVALSKYAKAHGLIIRELYDAIACLRRRVGGTRRDQRTRERYQRSIQCRENTGSSLQKLARRIREGA